MNIKSDVVDQPKIKTTNTPQGGPGVPPRGTNPDDGNPPKDKDDQKRRIGNKNGN